MRINVYANDDNYGVGPGAVAWLAGLSIPSGALVSSNIVLRNACLRIELDSFVSYFGGGALLAAIALVLIPVGIEHASALFAGIAFGAGGILFWGFAAYHEMQENINSRCRLLLIFFVVSMVGQSTISPLKLA